MTQRKKPKVVGCWYLLDAQGNACWRAPTLTAREIAKRERDGYGFFAYMVPADPAAAAVAKTALARKLAWRAWANDVHSVAKWRAHVKADEAFEVAVEKMQRKAKR